VLTFASLRLGLENLNPTSSRIDRPNASLLLESTQAGSSASASKADSGGSVRAIGCFRQLVIPSAVKGFMISLRSHDFSETRWLTGFIVTKPNIKPGF